VHSKTDTDKYFVSSCNPNLTRSFYGQGYVEAEQFFAVHHVYFVIEDQDEVLHYWVVVFNVKCWTMSE